MNARNAREWTANARVRLFLPGGRGEDPTRGALHIQTIAFGVGKAANDSRVSGVSLSIRSTRRGDMSIGLAYFDTSAAPVTADLPTCRVSGEGRKDLGYGG